MKYRPEIDGLRSVAVLPVIFFHAGFEVFSGGFVGVDIFFVISGYLITLVLVEDIEKGRFSILRFYERRARRILPALFFVMAVCAPFAWLWMYPSQLRDFGNSVIMTTFFISNIFYWRQIDYFAPDAELNPLLHTWSLAVEEQFYIFYPPILLGLWILTVRTPAFRLGIIATAAILSLGLAQWGAYNVPGANFYLLPTRAWELLAGSVCALLLHRRAWHSRDWIAHPGLLAIAVSSVAFHAQTPFPSLWALLPVLGTVAVILGAGPGSITYTGLAWRPMVAVGLVSYSAYLWHQPLFAFARVRSLEDPSAPVMLGLSALALVFAAFSWRYVERPFRTGSHALPLGQRGIFALSGAGMALFAVSAGALILGDGIPSRTAPSGQTFAALDIDQQVAPAVGRNSCTFDDLSSQACTSQGKGAEFVVWGDSFAMHLYEAMLASPGAGPTILHGKPACAPMIGVSLVNQKFTHPWAKRCIAFNDRMIEHLSRTRSVKYVVLSSPFGFLDQTLVDTLIDRNGQTHEPADIDFLADKLRETGEAIREAGAAPIFVSPPPRTGADLSSCPKKLLVFGGGNPLDCGFALSKTWTRDARIREVLQPDLIGMPVVWLDDVLCPQGYCRTMTDNGTIIFRDSGHISREGSRWLGQAFDLADAVRQAASAAAN